MDMNETQSKALERGLNDATALSQDEWRGVALAMMAQCQPWYEELERLRAAVEGLHRELTESRNGDASEVDNGLGSTLFAMRAMAYQRALNLGRELGLWK